MTVKKACTKRPRTRRPSCPDCYGKGYSTRLWGGGLTTPDLEDDESYHIPIQLEIKFCTCWMGKHRKRNARRIIEKETKRLRLT